MTGFFIFGLLSCFVFMLLLLISIDKIKNCKNQSTKNTLFFFTALAFLAVMYCVLLFIAG